MLLKADPGHLTKLRIFMSFLRVRLGVEPGGSQQCIAVMIVGHSTGTLVVN